MPRLQYTFTPCYTEPLYSLDLEMNSLKSGSNKKFYGNALDETIPLGWTRIRRKRGRTTDEISFEHGDCDCRMPGAHCLGSRIQLPPSNKAADSVWSALDQSTVRAKKSFSGKAIFCLHEIDPAWFQGYFFVEGMRKPWGLLAQQTSVDDCLACSDGGYRELSLEIQPFGNGMTNITIERIIWTGGDMMQWQSPAGNLHMEAEYLLTDEKAIPVLRRLFCGLLKHIQDCQLDAGNDTYDAKLTNVLGLIPDVVVVGAHMTVEIEDD